HLKLPIHPPRCQNRADVERRLQDRHVQFAVGETAEIKPVGHAVQRGFNYVWLRECVGELAVGALRGIIDEHHFHLPIATGRKITRRSLSVEYERSCAANVPTPLGEAHAALPPPATTVGWETNDAGYVQAMSLER